MTRLDHVHVLVVDDEFEVRDVVAEILELAGATVSSAASGQEAVERLSSCPVDVIVTDLRMINGDGFWLLRRVRDRGFVMPVIAVSGHFDEGEREHVLAAGFDAVVPKPLQFDDLVRAIARSAGR
jgi:CheY-like chemotaxis protein